MIEARIDPMPEGGVKIWLHCSRRAQMLTGPTLASAQWSNIFPNPRVSLAKADTTGPGNSGCKIRFSFSQGLLLSAESWFHLKLVQKILPVREAMGYWEDGWNCCSDRNRFPRQLDRTDTSELWQHAYVRPNKQLCHPAGQQLFYLCIWHWCRCWNITSPLSSAMQESYWKTGDHQRTVRRRMKRLEK